MQEISVSGGVRSPNGLPPAAEPARVRAMSAMLRSLIGVFSLLAASAALSPAASAQPMGTPIDTRTIIVCPASPEDTVPPDFVAPDCATAPIMGVDPQGRMIWVRATVTLEPQQIDAPEPLGVFVSAKASSEVWLNGVMIGRNGIPALTRADETPGRMDAVLPAPRELLRAGDNTIALRMSSQQGYWRLATPLHWVTVGPYQPPQFAQLQRYWPSLITFGVLLAGGLYFAVLAVGAESWRAPALLAVMALFAAVQLFAEVSRGLFAYPYPVHDLRLIAILLCSLGFGLSLAAHIVFMFEEKRPRALFAGVAGVTLLVATVSPGFDYKSAFAILLPALACVAMSMLWTVQRKPQAAWHLGALAVFAAIIIAAPTVFLDTAFFYVVTAYLLFLFVQQARALAEERRQRRLEAERASQLALVLEQREAVKADAATASIKVTGAGRIELVPLDEVAFVRGAGDYVEIVLLSGREILHADSLNALEASLPATFVRVHRSHIVNTTHVRTLKREASGVGVLVLANDAELPVSRRVLPKVRVAIG